MHCPLKHEAVGGSRRPRLATFQNKQVKISTISILLLF